MFFFCLGLLWSHTNKVERNGKNVVFLNYYLGQWFTASSNGQL